MPYLHILDYNDGYKYIGEFYTTGYVELNAQGEVTKVTFYGKIINQY